MKVTITTPYIDNHTIDRLSTADIHGILPNVKYIIGGTRTSDIGSNDNNMGLIHSITRDHIYTTLSNISSSYRFRKCITNELVGLNGASYRDHNAIVLDRMFYVQGNRFITESLRYDILFCNRHNTKNYEADSIMVLLFDAHDGRSYVFRQISLLEVYSYNNMPSLDSQSISSIIMHRINSNIRRTRSCIAQRALKNEGSFAYVRIASIVVMIPLHLLDGVTHVDSPLYNTNPTNILDVNFVIAEHTVRLLISVLITSLFHRQIVQMMNIHMNHSDPLFILNLFVLCMKVFRIHLFDLRPLEAYLMHSIVYNPAYTSIIDLARQHICTCDVSVRLQKRMRS